MAFCTNCGTKLHDGNKFCQECGTPVAVRNQPKNHDANEMRSANPSNAVPLPQRELQAEPRVEPRAEPRAEQRVGPRAEPRAEQRVEPRVESRAEQRVEPRDDPHMYAQKPPSDRGKKKPMDGFIIAVIIVGILMTIATVGLVIGVRQFAKGADTDDDAGKTQTESPKKPTKVASSDDDESKDDNKESESDDQGNDGASEIPLEWNGTWYGAMTIDEATGEFADVELGKYDIYMIVEVDDKGVGEFSVYFDGVDEAFAVGECEVSDTRLLSTKGDVLGEEMNTHNWSFFPMHEYTDQYTMADALEVADGVLDYTIFIKKWGRSWQKEIDSNFAIVPNNVQEYEHAIANGELPPVGFAPLDYTDTADGGGNAGNADTGETSTAAGQSGEVSGGATETYSYFDQIFLTFPSDTFEIDEDAIFDTIKTKDNKIKISIIPKISPADYEDGMKRFDSYSDNEKYSSEMLSIAGYDARRVTYYDDLFEEYRADVYVNFNGEKHGVYGIQFNISSTESVEACLDDGVFRVINSLEVVE